MVRRLVPLFVVVVFLLTAAETFGQSTLGTILGTVKDSSGGVVAGATVRVTDVDEGASRTFHTDANGNYEAVNTKAGHYAVEVTNSGFETERVQGLQLVARQTLRVDATLRLGKVAQTVLVTAADAGVITTETQTISSTYNSLQILNLPGNYRAAGSTSPYALLSAMPGVQSDNGNSFSIQGGIPSQSQWTVDGISTTDVTGNQPLQQAFPSVESIAEIKVQGVGSPAEYGDPGDVTTISKSGTNTLHGSVFWYHQDASLDAITYGQTSKPQLIANDYGFSLGGPVVIPHLYHGKNKTFFFGTFEGFQFPRGGTIQDRVPTSAMRGGDLSYLCSSGFNAAGICNDRSNGAVTDQIYNPATGQPFANDVIPTSLFNPISQKFLSLYPLPNTGDLNVIHDNNYNVNRSANYNSKQFDVRGDQYIGSKISMFGRFTFKNIDQLSPNQLLVPTTTDYERVRMLVYSLSYTLKPTLLNEFRFGYTMDNFGNSNPFDGVSFADSLGLQGIGPSFPFNGIPEVDFNNITSLNPDRLNGNNESRTTQFNDNLTWIKDRHTLKFGEDIRLIRARSPLDFYGADNYGTFQFESTFTGNEFSDFLLGLPTQTAHDIVKQDNDGRSKEWALFAQDSFRLSPRLTFEYGVRWEYDPAYTDAGGNIGNFDPSVPLSGRVLYPTGFASILAPGYLQSFDACPNPQISYTANDPASLNGAPCTPVLSASQAGLPEGLRTTENTRFLPRFGFAYKPFSNDKTVVRGGIGSYNVKSMGSIYYALTGTLQSDVRTYNNVGETGQPVFAWPQITNGGSGIGAPQYGSDYFGTANSIDWKEPYSLQWNMSVEHELGFGTGLRVSYIGMKTTQLVWSPDLNQSPPSTIPYSEQPLTSRPFPNWGIVNTRAIGATANYNSLQIEATRRFKSGLTFDSTYTWARSLADNQGPTANSLCDENSCNRSMDVYNRSLEYGNTYGDRQNRWITTAIYELPFGSSKRFGAGSGRLVNSIIGGWQMSNIFLIESGPFVTPYFTGGDPSGTGSGTVLGRNQHVDQVGPALPTSQNSGQWLLSSAFACPTGNCLVGTGAPGAPNPIGTFGTLGVGTMMGPGTINWNLGLAKYFNLTERAKLKVEVSFTNVLNHINFADPDLNITNANGPNQCGFGCISSARGLSDFSGARTGQIGARIDF